MAKTVEVTGKERERGRSIRTQGVCAAGCILDARMVERDIPGQSPQTIDHLSGM